MMIPEYLTIQQVCAIFGVTRETVKTWMSTGELPFVRPKDVGRYLKRLGRGGAIRVLFSRESVENLLVQKIDKYTRRIAPLVQALAYVRGESDGG